MAATAAAHLPIGTVVGGRYELTQAICGGSFGFIYMGTDMVTKCVIAMKVESTSAEHPQLLYETRVLNELQENASGPVPGVPRLLFRGQERGSCV